VVGGFTITSADAGIRKFWIEHGIRCREIGAAIGKALGKTCVTNLWIPDGVQVELPCRLLIEMASRETARRSRGPLAVGGRVFMPSGIQRLVDAGLCRGPCRWRRPISRQRMAVLDPELANARVGAGDREPAHTFGCAK